MQIIDFFPYFDGTGKELLLLRINILKDYVDKFVICESNKTHSGMSIKYELDKRIKEFNLPKEKIQIIKLDIPEENNLPVELIDIFNCYEDNKNKISIRARTRERLQKDSLLNVLHEYDDNTLFIVSDSDEIINPKYLFWLSSVVSSRQDIIIKIPLVHLEGYANLRVYKHSGSPKLWDCGMFMATKKQLKVASPTQIRSNINNPYKIEYLYENGNRVEDMGWHFSWMGKKEHRDLKRKNFTHFNDKFQNILGNEYTSSAITEFHSLDPKEGSISPSGELDTVLKLYPDSLLPLQIFLLPTVKDYLLPHYSKEIDLLEIEYTLACNKKTDINEHLPILKNLADNCISVTEFGTRDGQSTRAFLTSKAVIIRSYDLNLDSTVQALFDYAKKIGKNAEYLQKNVLDLEIEDSDLLFIDTWHTYEQLKQELFVHANKAKKYLVFHDTHTYGTKNENNLSENILGIGLLPAILEFLSDNPLWKVKLHKTNNNGLTILEKTLPL
jgi:beta-1,4-mannosyl-glycoprotein beta-1,4-N-acetylglucosaminyltransferase